MELKRPDRERLCTWKPNMENSPHTRRTEVPDRKKVLPDVLSVIGQTPMVQLKKISKIYGIKCEMFAKCEFMNPGGSVKDRIGYRMVQDAEEKGLLKPGYTIIEPTSGNTGIGLAMAAAVKGYRCIIVMPQKMSNEKVLVLQALGAEIVRTPTEAAWDSPESHIAVSQKLQREIPNSIILDQYTNSGNPLAHYDGTAVEILEQCEGKLDYLVAGAGTGGTVSGIARKFKEMSPETQIICVDPEGSILAEPTELRQTDTTFYEVEGIGYDFIPTVLDRSLIHKWIKCNDHDSFKAARLLIREEGLLCGGSSGAALSAALQFAKDVPEGKRMVVLLPDGIRNYLTKFVSDYWMAVRGFLELPSPIEANKWWWNLPLSTLSLKKALVLPKGTTCQEAVAMLQAEKSKALVCLDDKKLVTGAVTINTLTSKIISGAAKPTDPAETVKTKQFAEVVLSTTLGKLSYILEHETFAVIMDETAEGLALAGIVDQFDLLNFILTNNSGSVMNGGT